METIETMSEPSIWAVFSSPKRPLENRHTTIFRLFMMSRKSSDFVWPMIGMMEGRSNLPTLLIRRTEFTHLLRVP